jgi:alkaline phosphatase
MMIQQGDWSRREVLGLGVAAGVTMGVGGAAWGDSAAQASMPTGVVAGRKPKNIIFMVSDGMSMGVPSLAEPFGHLVRGRGTHWMALSADARVSRGYFDMASLSSLVTDSAAASSSWGSGSRVFNHCINVLPDKTELTPIGALAKSAGRRVGLVTTTTITHATPAGFAACVYNRGDQHIIAEQYLGKVDVLLGGGVEYFAADHRADGKDLFNEYERAGYAVRKTRDELMHTSRVPERLLGVFHRGHLPYTIDQNNDETLKRDVPTLAEMTRIALDSLAPSSKGFLLQVEGGRVDHAAHANDAAAIVWDQLAFDDAVGVALEFMRGNPETLLVVTTDHGNANPGLNGMGPNYSTSNECFERLAEAKASVGVIRHELRKLRGEDEDAVTADEATDVIRSLAGITLEKGDAQTIANTFSGTWPNELNHQHRNFVGLMGQILGNHNGVGWTGVSHTADWVPTLAIGPGQEHFGTLRRNTDAFVSLTGLMDITHVNPKMSPEKARQYAAAAREEDYFAHCA